MKIKFSTDKILQFFSGESKDYKYVKFRSDVIGTLKWYNFRTLGVGNVEWKIGIAKKKIL